MSISESPQAMPVPQKTMLPAWERLVHPMCHTMRYSRLCPPPRCHTVMRPWLLRPPLLRRPNVRGLWGSPFQSPSREVTTLPRKPGVVGLYALSPTSGPLDLQRTKTPDKLSNTEPVASAVCHQLDCLEANPRLPSGQAWERTWSVSASQPSGGAALRQVLGLRGHSAWAPHSRNKPKAASGGPVTPCLPSSRGCAPQRLPRPRAGASTWRAGRRAGRHSRPERRRAGPAVAAAARQARRGGVWAAAGGRCPGSGGGRRTMGGDGGALAPASALGAWAAPHALQYPTSPPPVAILRLGVCTCLHCACPA